MIQAQYSIDESDAVKAALLHFKANGCASTVRTWGIVCLIFAGLAFVFPRIGGGAAGFPFVIFGVFLLGYHRIFLPGGVKRNFRKLPLRNELMTWIFNDERFDAKGLTFGFGQDWSTLFRAIETKEYLLLYPQENIYYLVPARALPVTDFRQVCDLAKAKVPNHKKYVGD